MSISAYRPRMTYTLSGSMVLGALSIVFVFLPDVRLPWGMAALDFIALPWLIAFLLLGPKGGILTSVIGSLGITLFSEEVVPWIGATMKFLATMPMIVVPTLLLKLSPLNYSASSLKTKRTYAGVMALAILTRCVLCIFFNYYLAVPLMFGLKPEEVPGHFNFFFWGTPLAQSALTYFILGVSLWNTWQGMVDAVVAWIIVYSRKIYERYGAW